MKQLEHAHLEHLQGLVITANRRSATILTKTDSKEIVCKVSAQIEAPIVGDNVAAEIRNEHVLLTDVRPRKNCLSRSYANKVKAIAANLDRVYLIVAPHDLFNEEFVDRVLITCSYQNIPVSLVFNKADLTRDALDSRLDIYAKLGYEIIASSTKVEPGLDALVQQLNTRPDEIIALVGMSGVGKSSILNKLVKDAKRATNVTSHKTGKGQQTTSQAAGFLYMRSDSNLKSEATILIIDLPGIQNFGTSSLPLEVIAECFPEFLEMNPNCAFTDCKHLEEPNCAIKEAVETGHIAFSRYQSYKNIIKEIESFKAY